MKKTQGKKQHKNTDFIVLNGVAALNAERSSVTLIRREGDVTEWRSRTKKYLAKQLIGALEGWLEQGSR